ncbi:hypothetical protein BDY24DRAFT_399746 [Mrakia frigida]|uniref:uncharacterized protein n=1 Tax=Mrakia frigida TaxID=29902 RepID=UPI003FCC1569
MEVDVNEPTDDTVDPKWYTLEMGHELMWAVVNLKDKNGIALASEFYVYPDLDVHVDYLMQIPDAFTLRDVQDHLDTGSHASLYYVKKYLDGCFKQARDYFPADHRLHKAAVQLTVRCCSSSRSTALSISSPSFLPDASLFSPCLFPSFQAIVKQTYDYLPFAVDASPSPTALIYGKPTPYVVRPPRPFTDEGFDHIVDFTAKKLHRTNNQSRRSLYGLSPDFFDELASQDIPSATWYLFYVKGTKKFSSAIRPMTKAIRTTLGKLQGDVNANAGGEDAMVDASAGSGTVAASGAVRTAAPPIMLGSPRPRPPAVAPNAAKPSITRPLHPPTVPSTSTPSSEPSSSTLPASMSKPKVLPPPTVASSTPNVRPSGVAPTPKQAGWLSGLLKETIAAAAPDSGSASTSATSPPTRASVVHRAPQPFPQTLSSTSPSDALSPPSDLATPTNPSSVAPSFPVASAPTLDEPNSTVEESTAVVDESQRPDEPEVAMEPAPSPSSTQPISSSATPMDTSETLPLFASEPKSEETSSKDEGQDAFNELLLLSQGVASYGMEASDDEDEDDVDFGSMSHEEFVAYTDRNKASTKPFSTSPTPSPFPTLPLTSSSAASRPSSISTESTTLRLENTRLSTRNSELRSCLDDLSEKMKRGKEEHASQVQALHAALASKDAQLVVLKDATEADWRARFVKLEEEKEALEAKWKAKELEEERKAEERRAALAALMGTL